MTSADTTPATIDSYGASMGQSKVVVIRLKGAPTSPRQVPITATLKTGTFILSTRTIVVTVNP